MRPELLKTKLELARLRGELIGTLKILLLHPTELNIQGIKQRIKELEEGIIWSCDKCDDGWIRTNLGDVIEHKSCECQKEIKNN